MHTIRLHHDRHLLLAQDVRLLAMFDGALAPQPPDTPAPATHDFLVMCLRPDDPPTPRTTRNALRSAAA